MRLAVHLLAVTYFLTSVTCDEKNTNEIEARKFLKHYDKMASRIFHNYTLVQWQVFVKNTISKRDLLRKMDKRKANFMRNMRARALSFDASAMSSDTQRQLSKIKNIGIAAQPNKTAEKELTGIMIEMEAIVGNAKLCHAPDLTCSDTTPSFLNPTDSHLVLSKLWINWRNKTGRRIKSLFTRYVELSNNAVQLTGYGDLGEQWRSRYESDTFREDLTYLYKKIRPLYEQLHAYVRKELDKVHLKRFPKTGHIPAYLLGNMMADEWSQLYDHTQIYRKTRYRWDLELERQRLLPGGSDHNFTTQTYKVSESAEYRWQDILRMAETYLVSLGFDKMDPSFWTRIMYYRTRHGQDGSWRGFVWDLFDENDFRVAFSRFTGETQYYDIYNKMAQLQYFKQYKDQPVIYREGANDAFLDAVGGAIELSIRNLDYLKAMGLTQRNPTTHYQEMNYQLSIALEKVAFLPFAYLVDEWRWSVFNGSTTPENYNAAWWSLRCDLQGVSSPVDRRDTAFDAGGVYEIAANKPYIKHFLSTILQFQILKSLCHAAKHKGPLHQCNLQNSTEAGRKLRVMMKLGSSVPWQTALKQLTGHSRIEADAMLEYFEPLMDVLKCKNEKKIGWESSCDKRIRISG